MRRWHEEDPERLQREKSALQTGGFLFELDEEHQRRTGLILMRGTYTRDGHEPIRLDVVYPDSFPYLRAEVFAPQLSLGRHQNPYRRNLCLLDQSTRAWDPETTVAELIAEQTPKLLDALKAGDEEAMLAVETVQGEPASRYFLHEPGGVVFVSEPFLSLPPDAAGGILRLALGRSEAQSDELRACLSVVEAPDERGRLRSFAPLPDPLAARFPLAGPSGIWVRLDSLPTEGAGNAAALLATARQTAAYQKIALHNKPDGSRTRVTAAVFREEVKQGLYEDGWLFAVETTAPPPKRGKSGRMVIDRSNAKAPYVVRGHRLTDQDLTARIPSLRGLSEKTVSLAGVGAIGGPLAFELARAQTGQLRVLDDDIVDTGTVVRWPLGIAVAGRHKLAVLQTVLPENWPFTDLRVFGHRIGAVPAPDETAGEPEHELLTRFLCETDLFVDATAEIGVQHLLSRLADEQGIPQVYVWGTDGGWGGGVARVVPGQTGCWLCLQLHMDGADRTIVPPEAASTTLVQPRGCGTPTWTGSSFDAMTVVAQAARVISGTLLHGRVGSSPGDVFICDQPPDDGMVATPNWRTYPLETHPECPYCAARS